MAVIYELILHEGYWIPTKRSDEGGPIINLCHHRHRSQREAQKCLTRNMPPSGLDTSWSTGGGGPDFF